MTKAEFFKAPVVNAIKGRYPFKIIYQGKERVVAPFLLALTKDDRCAVHGLQIGGETSKGLVTKPEWRWLYLDEFGDTISVAEGYEWPQTELKKSEYVQPKFVKQVLAIYESNEPDGNS